MEVAGQTTTTAVHVYMHTKMKGTDCDISSDSIHALTEKAISNVEPIL
jgi:hypothetical protein